MRRKPTSRANENTARNRLRDLAWCADDVMTRVKLKGYQDSYAEAMAKYGLQRGIDGSEARHVTTQEFYRNAIAQQQGLQDNIGELLRIEAEKREAIERASKQEQVTRDELTKTEAELKAVKGELKAERLKNSAAEVGTTIIDGIGANDRHVESQAAGATNCRISRADRRTETRKYCSPKRDQNPKIHA